VRLAKPRPAYHASTPKPTVADIRYGTHERQVLDFWKVQSASNVKPAPLVFSIGSGSWLTGSKEIIKGCVDVNALWKVGIVPPVKAPLEDEPAAWGQPISIIVP